MINLFLCSQWTCLQTLYLTQTLFGSILSDQMMPYKQTEVIIWVLSINTRHIMTLIATYISVKEPMLKFNNVIFRSNLNNQMRWLYIFKLILIITPDNLLFLLTVFIWSREWTFLNFRGDIRYPCSKANIQFGQINKANTLLLRIAMGLVIDINIKWQGYKTVKGFTIWGQSNISLQLLRLSKGRILWRKSMALELMLRDLYF